MFSGIEKRRISKRDRLVKVKHFPEATINGMYDYIKQLWKKYPVYILHAGNTNTVNEALKVVLSKLLNQNKFVEKDCTGK